MRRRGAPSDAVMRRRSEESDGGNQSPNERLSKGNSPGLHAYLRGRDSLLAHSLLGPPRNRLIDIGSGKGDDLRHLIASGWNAVGVDPLQHAASMPTVTAIAERLPFRDESFDALTCVLVMSH